MGCVENGPPAAWCFNRSLGARSRPAALHLTDLATAIRAAIAWKLAGPLAATGQALAQGRIDFDKVRTICDAVTGLTHADMAAVQDQVLDAAERCTLGRLRPLLRKAVAAIAPEHDERRTRDAEDSRRVEIWPTPDGTVDLCGRDLPEVDAHAAFNRLTALARARKSDGDTRPLEQVRADMFLECLRGLIPADTAPCLPADVSLAKLTEGLTERIAATETRQRELTTPPALTALIQPGADVAARWQAAPVSARRKAAEILLSPRYLGEVRITPSPVTGHRAPALDRIVWHKTPDR